MYSDATCSSVDTTCVGLGVGHVRQHVRAVATDYKYPVMSATIGPVLHVHVYTVWSPNCYNSPMLHVHVYIHVYTCYEGRGGVFAIIVPMLHAMCMRTHVCGGWTLTV